MSSSLLNMKSSLSQTDDGWIRKKTFTKTCQYILSMLFNDTPLPSGCDVNNLYKYLCENCTRMNWGLVESYLYVHRHQEDTVRRIKYFLTLGMIMVVRNDCSPPHANQQQCRVATDSGERLKRVAAFTKRFNKVVDWSFVGKVANCDELNVWKHRLDWTEVCRYNSLSSVAIRKFHDILDWRALCRFQPLDLYIVVEYETHILWDEYSLNIAPNADVLDVFKDKIHWDLLSASPYCTVELLLRFNQHIDWWIVSVNNIACPNVEVLNVVRSLGRQRVLTRALIQLTESDNTDNVDACQQFLRSYSTYLDPFVLITYMMRNRSTPLLNTVTGIDYYRRWYYIIRGSGFVFPTEVPVDTVTPHAASVLPVPTTRSSQPRIRCTLAVDALRLSDTLRVMKSYKQMYNTNSFVKYTCCVTNDIRKCNALLASNVENFVWHTGTCVVCLDENVAINIVLLPCRHAVTCHECTENLIGCFACPYCRNTIKEIIMN